MKTTNNAQETVRGRKSVSVLRGSAVIFSLVLLSWTVSAQEFWEEVLSGYNYGKMAIVRVDVPSASTDAIHTEQATQTDNSLESTFEAIEAELTLQVEQYNATDFVEAELASETETWMNNNYEAVEVELTLQVEEYNATEFAEPELATETENWMNSNTDATEVKLKEIMKFDAAEYVEAELAAETENWMNGNTETAENELTQKVDESNTVESAEAENLMKSDIDAMEVKLKEMMKFDAADYVEAELAAETENWMNGTTESTDAELTQKIDQYNAAEFVEAELATETENWMNNNTEFNFEAIETFLSIPVQVYNAREFAEAEMAKETEIWLKKDEMSTEDQLFPDQQNGTKIERYALK